MKKQLSFAVLALFALPLIGTACTTETIVKKKPAEENPAVPDGGAEVDAAPIEPEPPVMSTPDKCLDGQDMDAADVDIKTCPPIPELPEQAKMGTKTIGLGAWELGETADGEAYKYGTLTAPDGTKPRTLEYEGGSVEVNAENLECWAKGYYRLRKILQDAPPEYVALHKAGFQVRFFQFQTDLRNGPTGYKGIASFEDHLVKWVTVITDKGVCQQPTLSKFKAYAKSELTRRGLPVPN